MKKLSLLLLLSLPATAAPASPADTLLLRRFLVAAADTSISDSVLVTRFMCADFLFRRHEPHVDTTVALLRSSLYFLRAGLFKNQPSVRRSKLIPFKELPHQPFTLADGAAGVYVAVDGQKPMLFLQVRDEHITSFVLSHFQGKAHFHDYCH
jgi:hypothetical protein